MSPGRSKLAGALGNNSGSGSNLISNLNSGGGIGGGGSPKRGIISSSATKKTNGPLLSRGSHNSGGGQFDRSEIIGNSYSPLARKNSQRRDTTLSASS